VTKGAAFPTPQEIETEVAAFLNEAKNKNQPIDWITIAGNGEPTLHPHFSEIVDRLVALRNLIALGVPIGILSNSSTCHELEIHRALLKLDGRFMKLDAGQKQAFQEINAPAAAARWEEIITGLYRLRNLTLQSLFFMGSRQNISDDLLKDWMTAVSYIRPSSVQIYTLDRPPREENLLPVSRDVLEAIAKRLVEKTGVQGIVFDREN
jgi:wyosine [tRNA(Phe)-imidazoG37] synthetase (radical SAM superfamily)